MAALTATAWTETLEEQRIDNKQRTCRVKLALSATQGLTYPSSGGIPLPTTLGMRRNVDYVNIIQPLHGGGAGPANSYLWAYQVSSHSIRGYQAAASDAAVATGFAELPTTWKPSLGVGTAPVMYVESKGW